jgi:hypothetical protein
MVGYTKGNYFLRYRSFESWVHLNKLAERWLAEESDPMFLRNVKGIALERFEREQPSLKPLPLACYATSYKE